MTSSSEIPTSGLAKTVIFCCSVWGLLPQPRCLQTTMKYEGPSHRAARSQQARVLRRFLYFSHWAERQYLLSVVTVAENKLGLKGEAGFAHTPCFAFSDKHQPQAEIPQGAERGDRAGCREEARSHTRLGRPSPWAVSGQVDTAKPVGQSGRPQSTRVPSRRPRGRCQGWIPALQLQPCSSARAICSPWSPKAWPCVTATPGPSC